MAQTETDWKTKLTPAQYQVLREKGTEPAFTGAYHATKEPGVYRCAGCGAELFASADKFDSGTGWPSFVAALADDRVKLLPDDSLGLQRTEVICSRCGGHLGHVFDDGPRERGGKRYCINSCALDFTKQD